MTSLNVGTAADHRELTAEEVEFVAGGVILQALAVAKKLADLTGGEGFFAHLRELARNN